MSISSELHRHSERVVAGLVRSHILDRVAKRALPRSSYHHSCWEDSKLIYKNSIGSALQVR
jgi:hypothetical protein